MERFKGHHLVAEALSLLPSCRRPGLRLVYERCDETYRDEVRAICARSGVEVEEHRSIDDATLSCLYATSIATVLAASLEPFGLTMLESMASGTPVIAVREGGYREVVESGINGLLVDRSAKGIAGGIETIQTDPIGVGEAIRGRILPFWSWDSAVHRQLDAIRSLIGE